MPNFPFMHPLVQNLFKHVEAVGLPLTFDISDRIGGDYGLHDNPGLPQLESCLIKFPRLFRRYQNLCGDLSANSGYNALTRDREYAVTFINEFQDRLLFGTDICDPTKPLPLAGFITNLKNEGKISEETFRKVAKENTAKLLGL